ncbi:MAG: orotate phosphoribosyltransferase [Deltaproteobacteria bacterium]|nr:orotate phosphoribosyltransferase [Deltaproteobacteria bacterium]
MDREIARCLMEIGAVTLRADPPFKWASGRFAPIYCDNRLLMNYPDHRRRVAESFAAVIRTAGWEPEIIAGTATAGIPHAAWLADLLSLPMVYVRGSAKAHGKGRRIEGLLEGGRRVVLVEDLVSTGGSSIDAALALVEAKAELLGVAAIFTYGLPVAAARFDEAGIPLTTLTSFDELMDEALSLGKLSAAHKAILADWQRDPSAWSVERGGAT